MTNIIVMGAAGRMGQMVLQACADLSKHDSSCRVHAAIEAPGSEHRGKPVNIPGIDLLISDKLEDHLLKDAVIIDFTISAATLKTLEKALAASCKMVIGTTGFSDSEKEVIREASQKIAILMAPNMSQGVNLLFKISELVASKLGEEYDIEIVEAHHNQKKDAPSGTAFGLAEAVAKGRQVDLKKVANYGRKGLVGARPKGEIGIHALRGGDIVGDHTVLFAGPGERIELRHVAHSRQTFAQGAVRAAQFLGAKTQGLFHMRDVLEL